MNKIWKWVVGIALILTALVIVPLAWQFFMPYSGGYGMMRGYGYGMPMMGGFGMMNPFGMWPMWLIPLGSFILIGFAAGWMANQFNRKQN